MRTSSATEIKLRESEAWSREFANLLPQFVYEIDTTGRLHFVNQYRLRSLRDHPGYA